MGCLVNAYVYNLQADFKMVRRALRGLVVEEYQKSKRMLNARAGRSSCVKNFSKSTNQAPPSNTSIILTKD